MALRKNYRNLTDVERNRFVEALFHLKSTGIVDQFANIHVTHMEHGIHRSSHFLPWHREFILRFENALRAHHPDITIPYWNSSVDRSPSDPLWNNSFLGQFNSVWGLGRALGSDTLPTEQQVDVNRGRTSYDAFWPELERSIHNPPHNWVGGVMASAASPGDPIFYLHHCWIDLLWVQWQLAHPGAPFVSSGSGLGLNDPLMEWPDRTPANVLNHHSLGYSYDIEPSRPFPIAPGGAAGGRSGLAAAVRGDEVDVFWVGPDGGIGATFARPSVDGGRWQRPFPIAPPRAAREGSPVAAAVRPNRQFDVFWVGPDGGIGTTFAPQGGSWQRPFPIAPGGAAAGGSGLTVAVRGDQVNIFWVGPDGGIGTTFTQPSVDGGRWQRPFPIAPPRAAREGSPAAAAVRGDQLDAYWIGPDAGIGSNFVNPQVPQWL
jgi:hypothetical protein